MWIGFLIAAGAAVFLFRIRSMRQAILGWPQTRGRVFSESIVFQRSGWSLFPKGKELYIAAVSFEYEVNGEKFAGCRLLPVGWTIRKDEQERVRRELVVFSTVLYNPSDPNEAYLDIPDRFQRGSISWITVALILSIFIMILFGILFLIDAS